MANKEAPLSNFMPEQGSDHTFSLNRPTVESQLAQSGVIFDTSEITGLATRIRNFAEGLRMGYEIGKAAIDRYRENSPAVRTLDALTMMIDMSGEVPFTDPGLRAIINEKVLRQYGLRVVSSGDSRLMRDKNAGQKIAHFVHQGASPDLIVNAYQKIGYEKVYLDPHAVSGSTSGESKEVFKRIMPDLIKSEAPPGVIDDDTGNDLLRYRQFARLGSSILLRGLGDSTAFEEDVLNTTFEMSLNFLAKCRMVAEVHKERIRDGRPGVQFFDVYLPPPLLHERNDMELPDLFHVHIPLRGIVREKVEYIGKMITGASVLAIRAALEQFEEEFPTESRGFPVLAFNLADLNSYEFFDGTHHYGPPGQRELKRRVNNRTAIRSEEGYESTVEELELAA